MTFENIKKGSASNIGYVGSTGDFLTGKDITETDLGNWVNNRYLDDLVPAIASQYPEDYEQIAKANFYKTSGTVSTSSTSTTLVASTSIFNNGMVGDKVYNYTDGDSAEITAYSSATTVTVDQTIGDTWDGDTIYVLGHEFAIGGDATDIRGIREVAVKYDEDNDYYTICTQTDQNQLFQDGSESYPTSSPRWYPTTLDVSGVMTSAIGILPEASKNISNGIRVRYLEFPAAMSADASEPRLPLGSHSILVYGSTADALRKMHRLEEAESYENLYQRGKLDMVAKYALTRQANTPKVRAPRRLSRIYNRTI